MASNIDYINPSDVNVDNIENYAPEIIAGSVLTTIENTDMPNYASNINTYRTNINSLVSYQQQRILNKHFRAVQPDNSNNFEPPSNALKGSIVLLYIN